jgi:hypothetical protein
MTTIRDLARARLDKFLSRIQPIRAGATRGQNYRMTRPFASASEHSSKAPLFGVDPHTADFALDWASSGRLRPQPYGPQPLESHENIHGYVNPNAERPIPEESPYQDPAISPRATRTSEGTDQKPILHGGSPVTRWDGEIRNIVKRPDFQAVRAKSALTEGDRAEKDLKAYPYDFSV